MTLGAPTQAGRKSDALLFDLLHVQPARLCLHSAGGRKVRRGFMELEKFGWPRVAPRFALVAALLRERARLGAETDQAV